MTKTPNIVGIKNWREDATSDTNFTKVLRSSFGVVGNRRDFLVVVILYILSLLCIIFSSHFGTLASPQNVAKMVGQWATLSANMSVAILGFLIAGFSIFATMTRPSLFRYMARYKSDGRSISDFKFVFYNFLYIFIHYLILLSISVLTSVLFTPNSPLWYLADIAYDIFPKFVSILTASYGAAIVVYMMFSLLLLKSFLWNLYQTLIFAIFVDPPALPSE